MSNMLVPRGDELPHQQQLDALAPLQPVDEGHDNAGIVYVNAERAELATMRAASEAECAEIERARQHIGADPHQDEVQHFRAKLETARREAEEARRARERRARDERVEPAQQNFGAVDPHQAELQRLRAELETARREAE